MELFVRWGAAVGPRGVPAPRLVIGPVALEAGAIAGALGALARHRAALEQALTCDVVGARIALPPGVSEDMLWAACARGAPLLVTLLNEIDAERMRLSLAANALVVEAPDQPRVFDALIPAAAVIYALLRELTWSSLSHEVTPWTTPLASLDDRVEIRACRNPPVGEALREVVAPTVTQLVPGDFFRRLAGVLPESSAASVGSDVIEDELMSVPLLDVISARDRLELVEVVQRRVLPAGQVLMRQGEPGASLFALVAGSALMTRREGGRDDEVAALEAGEVFGGLSVLTNEPRAVTVTALEPVTVLEIGAVDLRPLLDARPRLAEVLWEDVEYRRQQAIGEESILERVDAFFFGRQETIDDGQSIHDDRAHLFELLQRAPILSVLEDDELWELALEGRHGSFGRDQELVRQGEPGASLFIIEEGQVVVTEYSREGEVELGVLEAGALFGELSLLTGEPRTATVRAIGPVTTLEIARVDLLPIISRRPEVIAGLSELMLSRRPLASDTEVALEVPMLDRIRRFFLG